MKAKAFFIFTLIFSIFLLLYGCGSKEITITYKNEDGSIIENVVVERGLTIDLITPTKDGYTFIGWYDGDIKIESPAKFKDSIELTSKFEINKYTIKFVVDGETIKEEVLEYGQEITYPEDPEKEGTVQYHYIFEGWDCEDLTVTKDLIINAIFLQDINQYTYKFIDYNDEVLKEETIDYGEIPEAPVNPVRENENGKMYKFIGWDKEIEAIKENIIYKAVYEEKEISLNNMKVSILGDSISTFYSKDSEVNSYYSGENQFYYPLYSSTIKTVDLTWWYQLLQNTGLKLGINNSWSGSCAYGSDDSAGKSDARINTIDENGTPDIVIIYLGTNDCASGFTTEQFGSSIKEMINKINKKCNAQIFLTTLGYSAYKGSKYTDECRVDYNKELRKIANEYNCGIIPLDEYIINDNYMIYLGDNLHYNAKGAKLLSKIYEKHIKDFFGIAFNEEIEVEHQELLPEGVVGKITATTNSDFWGKYADNVFLFNGTGALSPQFSKRVEITKNNDNGKYYVSRILESGETDAIQNCDYVLIISDAHNDKMTLIESIKNVTVGCLVEFDQTDTFPINITFKENDGDSPGFDNNDNDNENNTPDTGDIIEGQMHVGAYNTGVWTLYETTVVAYSQDKIDVSSTYINFNVIKLTKNETDDNYIITGLKPTGQNTEFSECDYYILIFSSLEEVSYYNNAEIGDIVVINGDITTGNCNLEFK